MPYPCDYQNESCVPGIENLGNLEREAFPRVRGAFLSQRLQAEAQRKYRSAMRYLSTKLHEEEIFDGEMLLRYSPSAAVGLIKIPRLNTGLPYEVVDILPSEMTDRYKMRHRCAYRYFNAALSHYHRLCEIRSDVDGPPVRSIGLTAYANLSNSDRTVFYNRGEHRPLHSSGVSTLLLCEYSHMFYMSNRSAGRYVISHDNELTAFYTYREGMNALARYGDTYTSYKLRDKRRRNGIDWSAMNRDHRSYGTPERPKLVLFGVYQHHNKLFRKALKVDSIPTGLRVFIRWLGMNAPVVKGIGLVSPEKEGWNVFTLEGRYISDESTLEQVGQALEGNIPQYFQGSLPLPE